jgi:hypothetical protein
MSLLRRIDLLLHEDRKPGLTYKETQAKGILEKVSVELSGNESGVITKLAQRYVKLDEVVKKMISLKDATNTKIKENMEAYFGAEDIVLTKIIETAQFSLTLSKMMKGEEKKNVNYEKIANELAKLIPMELHSKVEEIIAAATSVKKENDKSPALRVKAKIEEGILDSVVAKAKAFLASIQNWAKSFDMKFAKIKSMIK